MGKYDCGIEGETPQDVLTVRKDGSVKLVNKGANDDAPDQAGTWKLDGNSGTFIFTDYGQLFTAKDDRVTFASEGAPREYICTRAS